MSPFILSLVAVAVVSAISLIGIATLSWKAGVLQRVVFLLISLAAGALLGDAFIHLLPEAFEEVADPLLVSLLALAGILIFFALEKYLHWHHSHGEDEFSPDHARIHPLGQLVIVSDGMHNFVDGLAIGAAFIVSPAAGIATAAAIVLHEIPQEIGDFGLLVHSGFTRGKALLMNFLSALTGFVGVGVAFLIVGVDEALIPLLAAFAAGNFIYIACADLVPELHKTRELKQSVLQFVALIAGLVVMVLLLGLE